MTTANVIKVKLNEIQFRKDLYPRIEFKQELVERYSNAIEFLPPIKINQNNILIDGWHRWKAHQLADKNDIEVEIVETESEKELRRLAYKWNSNHGLQLSSKEKKIFANEMIGEMTAKELSELLSISGSIIEKWTKKKREAIKEERDRKIMELYLRAWNTQESISDIMNISQGTISNIIKTFIKKRKITEINKSFEPYIYNIWNLQQADKETSHFGYFPEIFMENLLYYHTKPFDIIYDPFAGSGTTVDICKKYYRKYYCSDSKIVPGREEDIRQWKIQDGLPKDLPKPALLFLDPPYWKLAKDEYSEDDDDLGNMSFEKFEEKMNEFVKLLIARKVERIAYLIRPIYDNGFNWVDPVFKLHEILKDKYKIENRYVIPYSTQQYTALWVDRAKKAKKCLILNRELTVFKKRS